MMLRPAIIFGLVALTALSACGDRRSKGLMGTRQAFDGQYFRVKLDRDRENRAIFAVRVSDPGRSLLGAREAARHRANEYCIEQYGLSDITWQVSPDVEDAELPIVDGTLILNGECKGWR